MWTPTFVLATGALTVLALSVLLVISDLDDRRTPRLRRTGQVALWPAETLGRNALVVYVGQHLLGTSLDQTITASGESLTTRLVSDLAAGSNLVFALEWAIAAFAVAAVMRSMRWYVTV